MRDAPLAVMARSQADSEASAGLCLRESHSSQTLDRLGLCLIGGCIAVS